MKDIKTIVYQQAQFLMSDKTAEPTPIFPGNVANFIGEFNYNTETEIIFEEYLRHYEELKGKTLYY